MEEDHERKRRASIPHHRSFRQTSCRALQAFRGGSLAKTRSQPMLVLGLASVDPTLERNLGDYLRNHFSLAVLDFALVGCRRRSADGGLHTIRGDARRLGAILNRHDGWRHWCRACETEFGPDHIAQRSEGCCPRPRCPRPSAARDRAPRPRPGGRSPPCP